MRVGVILLIIIALIAAIPAEGVYTSWKKAYYIVIHNPYGDLRDHQVLVILNTRALIDNGIMRPDCGDLRFSDLSYNPLPYWVESGCGNPGTRIWVRVPELGHGDNRIVMYTGNPLAASESDEVATMDRAMAYGGGRNDEFFAIATDGEYVYVAGYTLSTGFGGYDGMIVKLDERLTPLKAKVFGGSSYDGFYGAYSDGTYIYAVGYTYSEGSGGYDAIVVKFDRDLNVVAKKVIGGRSHDWFYEITGDGRYLYAVGYTMSLTLRSYDAFIVKMDRDLNVLAMKALAGSGYEGFHYVTTDGSHVYAIGVTTTLGFGRNDGLVVKFDSDLNVLASKVYGGSDFDFFFGIAARDNRIYVAGYTMSAGSGQNDSLLVEFDEDLNVLKQKAYGGAGNDGVATLSFMGDDLYAVGYTESEGSGGKDVLLLEVDGDLNLVTAKRYGGTGDEWMSEITGLNGYVYVAGFTDTIGSGGKDAMAIRLFEGLNHISMTPSLPFGNSTLTYRDISLSLADSRLSVSTPSFTVRDSALNSGDAGLSLERAFLRKLPDLIGRMGPSLSEEEARKERIEAPDPMRLHCRSSFSGFPASHHYVTTLSDYRFNEDILATLTGYILNVNWSSGIYRGPFLYVGGPDRIPFHWRDYGVRFVRRGGIYRALELGGKVYEASYGHHDYAVVLVDCSSRDVRVAGITRYGTRAGLIWTVNFVRDLGRSGLFLIEWSDDNGNGLVESFEIRVVGR